MSSTISTDQQRLSKPSDMERSDVLDLFVRVTNLCEPEHKYDIEYPIDGSQIEFSWTSSYYAKCGPRTSGGYFAINMSWLEQRTIERLLSVMVHEISHFEHGIGRYEPTHPPEFWRAMARYTNTMKDDFSEVRSWFYKALDGELFLEEVVNDPNSYMVDNRSETVEERRKEMATLVGRNPETIVHES